MSTFDFSRVEHLLDTMPERGIPCAELAVTYQGRTVYRHNAGFADAERTKPLDGEDLYAVFSCTKIATCTSAMMLVEKGLIGLDDPVYKYLPAFKDLYVKDGNGIRPAKTTLTVLHLFTMTGGFNYDYTGTVALQNVTRKSGFKTIDFVNALAMGPLEFDPGTHFRYSLCHDVLGGVIEAVTGLTLEKYMKQALFDPLDMTDTTFHPTPSQWDRLVRMYNYDFSTAGATPAEDEHSVPLRTRSGFESGGGGLISKTDDYIRLMTMLSMKGSTPDGKQILKPETIKMMQHNELSGATARDFLGSRLFGYGWGLCGRVHVNPVQSLSRSSVGEFGWDGAAASFALADPEKEVALFFATHVHHCNYAYHLLHPVIRDMTYEALGL